MIAIKPLVLLHQPKVDFWRHILTAARLRVSCPFVLPHRRFLKLSGGLRFMFLFTTSPAACFFMPHFHRAYFLFDSFYEFPSWHVRQIRSLIWRGADAACTRLHLAPGYFQPRKFKLGSPSCSVHRASPPLRLFIECMMRAADAWEQKERAIACVWEKASCVITTPPKNNVRASETCSQCTLRNNRSVLLCELAAEKETLPALEHRVCVHIL